MAISALLVSEAACLVIHSSQIPVIELFKDATPFVKNILLLNSEGKRVAVKYFSDDWPTNSAKLAFEKFVFTKTQKTNARTEAEIAMFENNIVVYRFIQDLHFFVTGGDDENELALAAVLQGFYDAVTLLLRGNVDQREALENLDLIYLCLDEIVDGGMILETDGNMIAGKVATHSIDEGSPLSEQTITQAWAAAREHLTRSLLR
ncbi:coatomer subunit zeta-1 [Artemisia annua]|uniref:Coatomer subunit zeta n=1 Tax=Artemisia annua TaxID=35608 RepID=A0A2U1NBH0_ARTAN|nr:coatomer subunit zeta-1 [Artemisia annua]